LLIKGVRVRYWNEQEFGRLDALAKRALQAVAKFQRYLRSPEAKRNADIEARAERPDRQTDESDLDARTTMPND
jgi:hypothetical protein